VEKRDGKEAMALIFSVWVSSRVVFCRRLFTGVVLGQAAVALILGGSSWARAGFLVFVLAWLAFLILGRWGRGKQVHEPAQVLRPLEVVAFNIALTLALAELSLRLYAAVSGNSLLIAETVAAYRLVPGRDYGNGLRGNQFGYPGPDFRVEKGSGVCRIAALGDSFAVGPAVPFADNYLTRLEKLLPNVEVYNFGVSGAGPREYWTILNQHVWTYRPDAVLVSVFVGNDITEWMATPRHMDPRQYATYLLLARGGKLLLEKGARTLFTGAGNDSTEEKRVLTPLSQVTFDEVEARRLAVCLKETQPDLERKWQRALGYLQAIIEACRERSVPIFFVLIPDEFQVNPGVLARALAKAGRETSEMDLPLPQRRLQQFCDSQGVPCLDLLPAFARTPQTYAPRDTHWNVRGNELAAEQLAAWLARRGYGQAERPTVIDPEQP
jgi:hypothetical protein